MICFKNRIKNEKTVKRSSHGSAVFRLSVHNGGMMITIIRIVFHATWPRGFRFTSSKGITFFAISYLPFLGSILTNTKMHKSLLEKKTHREEKKKKKRTKRRRNNNVVVFSLAKVKWKSKNKMWVKNEEKLFNIYFSYSTAKVGLKTTEKIRRHPWPMSLTLRLHNFVVFVFVDKDFFKGNKIIPIASRGCCVISSRENKNSYKTENFIHPLSSLSAWKEKKITDFMIILLIY